LAKAQLRSGEGRAFFPANGVEREKEEENEGRCRAKGGKRGGGKGKPSQSQGKGRHEKKKGVLEKSSPDTHSLRKKKRKEGDNKRFGPARKKGSRLRKRKKRNIELRPEGSTSGREKGKKLMRCLVPAGEEKRPGGRKKTGPLICFGRMRGGGKGGNNYYYAGRKEEHKGGKTTKLR